MFSRVWIQSLAGLPGGSVKSKGLGDGSTPGACAANKSPIAKLPLDAATRMEEPFHRHVQPRRSCSGLVSGPTFASGPGSDIWGHHTQFKTEIRKVSPEFRALCRAEALGEYRGQSPIMATINWCLSVMRDGYALTGTLQTGSDPDHPNPCLFTGGIKGTRCEYAY